MLAGLYYTRPLTLEEWGLASLHLTGGASALVRATTLSYARQTCVAEDSGFEIRDCITVITPFEKVFYLLAQSPMEGSYVDNALTYGVAGYNIAGSRIGTSKRVPGSLSKNKQGGAVSFTLSNNETGEEDGHNPNLGRYPSNLILMHHPECKCVGTKRVRHSNGSGRAYERGNNRDSHASVTYGYGLKYRKGIFGHVDEDGTEEVEDWVCHPTCPVKRLDEQTADKIHSAGKSCSGYQSSSRGGSQDPTSFGLSGFRIPHRFGDSGGASRFFKTVRNQEELDLYLLRLICPPKGGEIRVILSSLNGDKTPFDEHIRLEDLK